MMSSNNEAENRITGRSVRERKTGRVNQFLEETTGWIPARIALAILSWFGFINLYMTRVNLSVIIVAMVGKNVSLEILAAPCLVKGVGNNDSSSLRVEQNDVSLPETTPEFSLQQIAKEEDIEWNETIQGFILGAFYYGYLMTQILGGRLAEKYGSKYVFGGCIFAGGICALLSPTIAQLHFGAFIALRVIHGMVQGVSWPAMHALISRWYPPFERPRFIGIVYWGTTLSVAITLPLCSLIIDRHGWPTAFYVTGSLSILWSIIWYIFMYNYPSQHPRISERELEYIEQAISKSGTSAKNRLKAPVPWKAILTSLPLWAILVGELGNDWCISLFFTQLPTYMKNILGFSIKENGMISAIPFITRYIGAVSQSVCADSIISNRRLSILTTRRLFSVLAMTCPALVWIAVIYAGCHVKIIIVLFCIGQFLNGAIASSVAVNHTDIAPNFAGTLYGITNSVSCIASFLQPVVTGIITTGQQTLQQWHKVFWICIPMFIGANAFFFVFCSGTVQQWNVVTQEEDKLDNAEMVQMSLPTESLNHKLTAKEVST